MTGEVMFACILKDLDEFLLVEVQIVWQLSWPFYTSPDTELMSQAGHQSE